MLNTNSGANTSQHTRHRERQIVILQDSSCNCKSSTRKAHRWLDYQYYRLPDAGSALYGSLMVLVHYIGPTKDPPKFKTYYLLILVAVLMIYLSCQT